MRRRDWAEEVLQEGFVSIWRHCGDYRPEAAQAMTWMAAIVRNRCLDWLRRAQPETSLDDGGGGIDEPLDGGAGPLELALEGQAAQELLECLKRLQARQRQAIALAYYRSLSHDELARHMNEALGTIKTWIRRGLEQLRNCLER